MRFVRALVAPAVLALCAGCGYVHFGRLPATPATDAAMAEAYTNLSLEHKILKQELALARKETDSLRVALDRAGGGGASGLPDVVAQLNQTTRELAALRASHAKLQAERAAPALEAARAKPAEAEEKLAASLQHAGELEQENARLRSDIDRARAENASLVEELKKVSATNGAAQAALAQLNTDLLAEKQARARAERATESAFAQLRAVTATRVEPPAPAPAGPPATAPLAATASALERAKAPPAGASPTAELRIGPDRVRPAPAADAAAKAPRTHTVQPGDTLEQIAMRYFGAPEHWRLVYEANAALLGNGQPLTPGMKLVVPER